MAHNTSFTDFSYIGRKERIYDAMYTRNDNDPKEIEHILSQLDKMEGSIKKLKKSVEKLKP